MTEDQLPLDDLAELAGDELTERRQEVGDEARARELLDVPSESAGDLAAQQERQSDQAG